MKADIILILHDIRSVYNVGAMFRTADAAGVSKIYLTGYTPAPTDRFGRKRSDVAKSALGAEDVVAWEARDDALGLIAELKHAGYQVIALEQSPRSSDYRRTQTKEKTVLVVGNETKGLPEQILNTADAVVEIPMRGKKESLNVSVAAGIALYELTRAVR